MHAKVENGVVLQYPIINLRSLLAEVSLPVDLTEDSILPYWYVYVNPTTQPVFNSFTHRLDRDTPVYKSGKWYESWQVLPLTPEQVEANKQAVLDSFAINVQESLDSFARTRNYDSILSACSYTASNNSDYAIEGQYCVNLRDDTWNKFYSILSDIQTGKQPFTYNYGDISAQLPQPAWPN